MLFFLVSLALALAVSFLLYLFIMQEMIREQNPIMANTWVQQHIMESHRTVLSKGPSSSAGAPANSWEHEFQTIVEELGKRFRHRETDIAFYSNPEKISDFAIFTTAALAEAREEQTKKLGEEYPEFLSTSHFPLQTADFNPGEAKHIEHFDENGTYHYFEEVRMDQTNLCYDCHKPFGDGELMGVVHMSVPKTSMRIATQKFFAYMLAAAIV